LLLQYNKTPCKRREPLPIMIDQPDRPWLDAGAQFYDWAGAGETIDLETLLAVWKTNRYITSPSVHIEGINTRGFPPDNALALGTRAY
jgi:hypothetical protein